MQGKVVVKKERKYHVATPHDAKSISAKYAAIKQERGRVTKKDIDPIDLDYMLDKYARELSYDLYTLCDVFCISRTTLYTMLKSDKYSELYASACARRSYSLFQYGFDVLDDTRRSAKNNDSSRDEINASRHLANYCLSLAEKLNPDMNQHSSDGNINIQINVPKFDYLTQRAKNAIEVTADPDDND